MQEAGRWTRPDLLVCGGAPPESNRRPIFIIDAPGVRNCDAAAVPAWAPDRVVPVGRVARIVTGRSETLVLGWRQRVGGWRCSASGPLVTGRLGRAFTAKCPQAAGTGLVTIAAGLIRSLSDPVGS